MQNAHQTLTSPALSQLGLVVRIVGSQIGDCSSGPEEWRMLQTEDRVEYHLRDLALENMRHQLTNFVGAQLVTVGYVIVSQRGSHFEHLGQHLHVRLMSGEYFGDKSADVAHFELVAWVELN